MQEALSIDDFPDPDGWDLDEDDPVNSAHRLILILLDLANVQHRARKIAVQRRHFPVSKQETLDIIAQAENLDRRLEEWFNTLPDAWAAHIVRVITETPEDVRGALFWPSPVYAYGNINICNSINEYHMSRLICQNIIREGVDALPSEDRMEHLHAAKYRALSISQRLADDFCNTVPYMLGYHVPEGPWMATTTEMKCKLIELVLCLRLFSDAISAI